MEENRHYYDLRTPHEFFELLRAKARQAHVHATACVYHVSCFDHGSHHVFAWEDQVTHEHGMLASETRLLLMLKVRRMVENAVLLMDVAKRAEESNGKELAS